MRLADMSESVAKGRKNNFMPSNMAVAVFETEIEVGRPKHVTPLGQWAEREGSHAGVKAVEEKK